LRSLAIDNPDAALVVTTDVGKSFRADIFGEYKGTRERMPDNLRSQIDGVFELFDAAGIETLSRE
jgi:DNA polymerase-1